MPAAGPGPELPPLTAPHSKDVTVPPIAANPTQGQAAVAPQGQQRIEVQGDLNNALTQQQGQLDGAVATRRCRLNRLPSRQSGMAPMAPRRRARRPSVRQQRPRVRLNVSRHRYRSEAQSKPQAVAKRRSESKPVQPKHVESTATTAPAKTSVSEKQTGGHHSEQTDHDDRSASGNGSCCSASSEDREDGR